MLYSLRKEPGNGAPQERIGNEVKYFNGPAAVSAGHGYMPLVLPGRLPLLESA